MVRQRMVKPEFFDSESLGACSIPARLAFIGLWVTSDDYGNQKAQASRLKLKIFPYDTMTDEQFVDLLCELEETGCIKGYVVEGERYITVPNFLTYQTVRKPSKSSIPEPPKTTVKQRSTTVIHEWRNGEAPVAESSSTTTPVQHEYATSNPKERSKERSKGVLTNSFTNEKASDGAAAMDAAPPPLVCQTCGLEMEPTGIFKSGTKRRMWRCPLCFTEEFE